MTTTTLPQAQSASGFPPWKDIFPRAQDLADNFASAPEFRDPSATVVRAMFVDLGEVMAELARLHKQEVPLTVHADTVRIGSDLTLAVPQFTLHARRVEVASGVRALTIRPAYDPKRAYSAVLSVGQVAFAGPDGRLTVDLLGVATDIPPATSPRSLTMTCAAGGQAGAVTARMAADLAPNDVNLAAHQLLVARCLNYIAEATPFAPQQLALDMAAWVHRCHGQPQGDARLYAQSQALHSTLAAAHAGTHLVPYLRREFYLDNARAIATALAAVESEYHRYVDHAGDSADKQAFAQFIHTQQAGVEQHARESLRVAQEDLKRADDDIAAITDKLTGYRDGLHALKQAFDAGIESRRLEIGGEIAVASAVAAIGIAAGIVTFCCTGNPSGPLDAAKAGDAAKQLMTTWERCKAAFDMVNRFLAMAKAIQEFVKLSDKTHQALEQTSVLKQWKDAQEAKAASTTSTDADWEEFQAKISAVADEIRSQGISGASEYFLALGDIAIRGRELYRAQLARNQRLQVACQRELDLQLAGRNLQASRQLLDRVDQPAAAADALQRSGHCERLATDLKLQLIQAIEGHLDALRYEQLYEPQCPKLFNLGTGEMATALAQSSTEILNALTASPRQMGSWREEIRIHQHDAIRQLRAHGALRWRLALDFPAFQKYECLHVEEIRVWLEGKDLGAGRVFATIGSSGDFDNRRGAQDFHFCAAPCDRDFSYAPYAGNDPGNRHGEPDKIYASADDPQKAYYLPTPFTVWEFAFPREDNHRLRYENITAVWVAFIGRQIRREPAKAKPEPVAVATATGTPPAPLQAPRG